MRDKGAAQKDDVLAWLSALLAEDASPEKFTRVGYLLAPLSRDPALSIHERELLRWVAHVFLEIGDGKDAKQLFGQEGRPKPTNRRRDFDCALNFWIARYKNPRAKDSVKDACYSARAALRDAGYPHWNLADPTIIDIARRFKQQVFNFLEDDRVRLRVLDGGREFIAGKGEAQRLREYIEGKSKGTVVPTRH